MITLLQPSEAARRLGIYRGTLDRLARLAPANLPGAPIQVGIGSTRRHYRYPADTLLDWFRAASEAVNATADATPANRPGPTRPSTTAPPLTSARPVRRLRDLTR